MNCLPPDQKPRVSPPAMSRQPQQHLVIRTVNSPTQSAKPSVSSASSPDPPYPNYPLAIPPEKLAKALKIYTQYRYEAGLEQRRREHSVNGYQNDSLLSVPGPMSTYSMTSCASSQPYTATSFATSTHEEGITDLSSLMSFNEDDERRTSASARADAELVAFNGNKVKQRIRRKLPPTAKAKAALVRWLGSCWVCRKRRVPCPIQHHNIEPLKEAYDARHNRPQRRQSVSSGSSFPYHQVITKAESTQGSSVPGRSQADFLGLGQNPRLLQTHVQFESQLDSQSPGGALLDPLADLPGPPTIKLEASDFTALERNHLENGPYANYQDGAMLAIGIQRGAMFYCQHLEGFCQEFFNDAESLQIHYELAHFAFTRINPFHYLLCSQCHCLNTHALGGCSVCGAPGSIDIWIFGRFIRTPPYRRFDTGSGELLRGAGRSANFQSPSSLGILDGFSQWEPDQGSGSSFSGRMGDGSLHNQSGHTYSGPPLQGAYSYSSFGGSQHSGFRSQPQSQLYNHTNHDRQHSTYLELYLHPISEVYQPNTARLLLRLVLLSILITTTSLFISHGILVVAIRSALLHTTFTTQYNLPFLGFVSAVFSCAVSWSMRESDARKCEQASKYRLLALTLLPFSKRSLWYERSVGVGADMG